MSEPQKPRPHRRGPHRWVANTREVSAAGRKGGQTAGAGRPLKRRPKPRSR